MGRRGEWGIGWEILDRRSAPSGYWESGSGLFAEALVQVCADAAAEFEGAAKLSSPRRISAIWGSLGDARWQIAGERADAREAFQKAYSLASRQMILHPGDIHLQSQRALYLAKLGRGAEARKAIEAAIAQGAAGPECNI